PALGNDVAQDAHTRLDAADELFDPRNARDFFLQWHPQSCLDRVGAVTLGEIDVGAFLEQHHPAAAHAPELAELCAPARADHGRAAGGVIPLIGRVVWRL